MRTVLVSPSPEWLEDRRERGADKWDEIWDGVLHVPPDPTSHHQRIEFRLAHELYSLVVRRGLEIFQQLPIFEPRKHTANYRRPDILVVETKHVLTRGTEGPVSLAIEILSPNDESRKKMPFYAKRGVQELWLVDPDSRAFEVYVLRGDKYEPVMPDESGLVRAPALDLELSLVAGPKLRIAWSGGSAEI